jgi:acetoin utilization deacetylase AcuC-like enzyme
MNQIPVYFTDQMVADACSYSPSARKPVEVVRSWLQLGALVNLNEPAPATFGDLCAAHDQQYVAGVLACQIDNGFRNRLPAVAASLPYTSGAMLAAARAALSNGQVAVAPCSGFHHAGWAYGGGFCTFNGLMMAAGVLRRERLLDRIGILDFDQHWGDGTHDIITKMDASGWVAHYSPAHDFGTVDSAERFILAIPDIASKFAGCDLVLYQAGADPHVADPLGGWLSDEQLYRRDAAVFRSLSDRGIPVAWNLAGGYQKPLRKVLDIHDRTLVACHTVYCSPNGAVGPTADSAAVGTAPIGAEQLT